MPDTIIIGKNIETNEDVGIEIEYLIDQKVQILGNSRSGKSRGGRVLAEKANKKIHQIIISPKKEFVTLREKFDYIHVGRTSELSNPDIELNTRYAEQLALDVMKIGMDVIIEFSEAPKERIKFVKQFVDGLMMVPQKDWHPTMVMIDEIDIWAPEKGHGDAESLGSIVDLAARGADKGYSLVAITQKLAKFNKDVASELNIKLIGNVSLDTDQNRACEELGIERKNKKVLATLGKPHYHFFAYGPGLSDKVIKIKFLDPITSHVPGWKLNKQLKPIPTPDKVKKLLSQFSGLEQEAEKEIKTKDDMKQKIQKLENELRIEKSKVTPGSPGDRKELVQALGEATGYKIKCKDLEKLVGSYEGYVNYLEKNIIENAQRIILDMMPNVDKFINGASMQIKKLFEELHHNHLKIAKEIKRPEFIIPKIPIQSSNEGREFIHASTQVTSPGPALEIEDLGEGPKKMLQAIKMFHPKPASFTQVGAIAVYTPGGGTFGNYQRELKRKGYATTSGKTFTLTQKGLDATKDAPVLPTDTESLFSLWSNKLGAGPTKMLRAILDNPGLTRDDLGDATNYTNGGGTFGNYLRELKRLQLIIITEDKYVKPNPEFFMMVTMI